MARPTTVHVCSECGHSSVRWHGQCPGCQAWNTLVEERAPASGAAAGWGRGGGGGAAGGKGVRAGTPTRLADVSTERVPRLLTEVRAQAFLAAATLIAEATSFGGVHSSAERRLRWAMDDVSPGFIRMSAGVEDAGDLVADVCAALDALLAACALDVRERCGALAGPRPAPELRLVAASAA